MQSTSLEFLELEQIDTPLEWWEHAGPITPIIGGAPALAT